MTHIPRSSVSLLLLSALLALASGLAAIWASQSRGAWLALGAGIVLTLVLPGRRAAAWFGLGMLILLAVILLGELNLIPASVADRFAVVGDYVGVFDVRGVRANDANFAVVERMAHWQAAWEMFWDHPWLGVGFGNYAAAYPAYALPRWDDPLGHAHNYILNVLAEGGILTAAGYIVFWVGAFAVALGAVRRARGGWRWAAAGLVGSLTALTVQNMFDNLYVHNLTLQVGLVLGLLGLIRRFGTPPADL